MGGCKSLGSLESFPWKTPQLSGTSILCFHILSSISTYQLTLYGCNLWWLWHPCLLIWREIFHFSPETKSPSSALNTKRIDGSGCLKFPNIFFLLKRDSILWLYYLWWTQVISSILGPTFGEGTHENFAVFFFKKKWGQRHIQKWWFSHHGP